MANTTPLVSSNAFYGTSTPQGSFLHRKNPHIISPVTTNTAATKPAPAPGVRTVPVPIRLVVAGPPRTTPGIKQTPLAPRSKTHSPPRTNAATPTSTIESSPHVPIHTHFVNNNTTNYKPQVGSIYITTQPIGVLSGAPRVIRVNANQSENPPPYEAIFNVAAEEHCEPFECPSVLVTGSPRKEKKRSLRSRLLRHITGKKAAAQASRINLANGVTKDSVEGTRNSGPRAQLVIQAPNGVIGQPRFSTPPNGISNDARYIDLSAYNSFNLAHPMGVEDHIQAFARQNSSLSSGNHVIVLHSVSEEPSQTSSISQASVTITTSPSCTVSNTHFVTSQLPQTTNSTSSAQENSFSNQAKSKSLPKKLDEYQNEVPLPTFSKEDNPKVVIDEVASGSSKPMSHLSKSEESSVHSVPVEANSKPRRKKRPSSAANSLQVEDQTDSSNNLTINLKPGMYKLNLNFANESKPSQTINFTVPTLGKNKSASPQSVGRPPDNPEPLYYENSKFSLPKRFVHLLKPSGLSSTRTTNSNCRPKVTVVQQTGGNKSSKVITVVTPGEHQQVLNQQATTREGVKRGFGRGCPTRSHKKERFRWAPFPCMHMNSSGIDETVSEASGCDSWFGYEGVEHLKRQSECKKVVPYGTPYEEPLYCEVCHGKVVDDHIAKSKLQDYYACKESSFSFRDTSDSCTLYDNFKLSNSYYEDTSNETIAGKKNFGSRSVYPNLQKNWLEDEAFLKRVVAEYFLDPLSDSESDACSSPCESNTLSDSSAVLSNSESDCPNLVNGNIIVRKSEESSIKSVEKCKKLVSSLDNSLEESTYYDPNETISSVFSDDSVGYDGDVEDLKLYDCLLHTDLQHPGTLQHIEKKRARCELSSECSEESDLEDFVVPKMKKRSGKPRHECCDEVHCAKLSVVGGLGSRTGCCMASVAPPLLLTEMGELASGTEITRVGDGGGGEREIEEGTPAACVSPPLSDATVVADRGLQYQCSAGCISEKHVFQSSRARVPSRGNISNRTANLGIGIQFVKPLKLKRFSESVFTSRNSSLKSKINLRATRVGSLSRSSEPKSVYADGSSSSLDDHMIRNGMVFERSNAASNPEKFDLVSALKSLKLLERDESMNSSLLSDSVFETSCGSEDEMANINFRQGIPRSYGHSTRAQEAIATKENTWDKETYRSPYYYNSDVGVDKLNVSENCVPSAKVRSRRSPRILKNSRVFDDKYEQYEFPSPQRPNSETQQMCSSDACSIPGVVILSESSSDDPKVPADSPSYKPGRKRFAKAFQRAVIQVPVTATQDNLVPPSKETVRTELVLDPIFPRPLVKNVTPGATCISEYKIGETSSSVRPYLVSSDKSGNLDSSSSEADMKKGLKHKKQKRSKPRKYFSGILDAIGSAAPIFRNSFSGSSIDSESFNSNDPSSKRNDAGSTNDLREMHKPRASLYTRQAMAEETRNDASVASGGMCASSPRLSGSPKNNFAHSAGTHDHWRAAYLGHVGCDSGQSQDCVVGNMSCHGNVLKNSSYPRCCIKKNSDVRSKQRNSISASEAMYENVVFLSNLKNNSTNLEIEPTNYDNIDVGSITNVTTTATITLNGNDLLDFNDSETCSNKLKNAKNSSHASGLNEHDLPTKNTCTEIIYEDWCSAVGDHDNRDTNDDYYRELEHGLSLDQRSDSNGSIHSEASSFYYTVGGSTVYEAVKNVRKSFADEFDSPGACEMSDSNSLCDSSDEMTYNTTLHENACENSEGGDFLDRTFGACSSVSSNGSDLMGQFNELHEKYFGKGTHVSADDQVERKTNEPPNNRSESCASGDSQDGIVRAVPCVVLTDSDSSDSFKTSANNPCSWSANNGTSGTLHTSLSNNRQSSNTKMTNQHDSSGTSKKFESKKVRCEGWDEESEISEEFEKRLSGMWTNGTGAEADEESEAEKSDLLDFSTRAHRSPPKSKWTSPTSVNQTYPFVSPSWNPRRQHACSKNVDSLRTNDRNESVESDPSYTAACCNSPYYVNIGDVGSFSEVKRGQFNGAANFESTSSSSPTVQTPSEPDNFYEDGTFLEKQCSSNDLSASFDSLDSEGGNLTENLCKFIGSKGAHRNNLEVPDPEEKPWERSYRDHHSEDVNQCSLLEDVITCLSGKWKVSSSSAPSTPCSNAPCDLNDKTASAPVRPNSNRCSRIGKPPVSPGSRPRDSGGAASRSSSFRRRSRSASAGAKLRGGTNNMTASTSRPTSMIGRPRPTSLADMMPGTQTCTNSQESLHSVSLLPSVDDIAPRPQWLAERKKAEGNEAYRNKDYRDALQYYTQAIDLCPDCAAYYSNRSACYMMLGKYRDALNDAQHAVTLDRLFVKGWVRVGKCHVALGDGMVAMSVLRQAQEIEPGNSAVLQEIASAQALQNCVRESQEAALKKDYRTAVFHLDQALRYALGGLDLRITKAEYLTYLGRASEAEDIVNDVLVSDSNHADALYVRGLCRYYQDNQDAAFQHFTKVLRLVPDHIKAKETYKRAKQLIQKKEEGNAAFKMGDFTRAMEIYSEALKIDDRNKSTNSKLYYNRATVAAKLGRLEQAISDCTAALELDESYIKAYMRRANTYQQTEQYEEAVRDLEKVYRMERSHENKRLLHDAKTQLKRSKRKDYYKILGVAKTATDDEIKKAYRKMALLHHPDRHSSASATEKAEHERKFKELGEAYAVLTDPKKRSMHDRGQDVNDPDCGGFRDASFDPNQVFEAFFGSDFFASQSHHYYDQGQGQHQQQQQQQQFPGQFQGQHAGFQGFPGGFQFGF